jgi:hypothetical protein
MQSDDGLLDRVAKGVPLDEAILLLAKPVDTPCRLHLLPRVVARLHQEDAVGGGQRVSNGGGGVGDDEDARAEARRLLQEAGVPNLRFEIISMSLPPFPTVAVWAIDQWRQIGVKVEHRQSETSPYLAGMSSGNFDVAVDFCAQLLEIVAVAHDHGIVHRDLQPESVIVAPGGRVKLFDFGIAKVRTPNMTEEDLTGTGVILGAPPFMAPEQALGRRELVDAQTDIYSVGATLFVLLSGQGLHDAPTPLAQIIAASSTPARSLRSVVNADLVPDAVVTVVDRALAFRKSDRWLDARTFASALRDACNGTLRQEAHPADHESDSPTLASGPELEPALLENLTAAQGIDLANPPPYASPVHV